jgi:hypothetical protein
LHRRLGGTRPDVPPYRHDTDSEKLANSHWDGNADRNGHARPDCHGIASRDGHARTHANGDADRDGHAKRHPDGHAKSQWDSYAISVTVIVWML